MKLPLKDMTIGELYMPAMKIKTKKKAQEYFEALVVYHMEKFGQTREEATSVQKQNLGYFAGYYDMETMKRVQKLFECSHPIFGSAIPTTDEAFKAGQKLAKEQK